MKITGGSLKVKETLTNAGRKGIPEEEIWEEKVDQIRIYSGAKFEMLKEAEAGTVCAVTGLTETIRERAWVLSGSLSCRFWSRC